MAEGVHSVTNSAAFSYMAYFLPPVISLIFFWKWKASLVWLSILVTMAVDLLVWGKALGYNYGEFRGLILLFLIPQLALTALAAVWIRLCHQSKEKRKERDPASP